MSLSVTGSRRLEVITEERMNDCNSHSYENNKIMLKTRVINKLIRIFGELQIYDGKINEKTSVIRYDQGETGWMRVLLLLLL